MLQLRPWQAQNYWKNKAVNPSTIEILPIFSHIDVATVPGGTVCSISSKKKETGLKIF